MTLINNQQIFELKYNGKIKKGLVKNMDAIEHVRQYNELEHQLGPIISDIKNAFLNLPIELLEDLLIPYEKLYGFKAKEYAIDAFPKWKYGRRKMSGQTAKRLLNLVPKYLTTDQRYEIVKKLCEYHIEEKERYLSIDIENPAPALDTFQKYLLEFQDTSYFKYLPEHVLEIATWLNDDDITVTRRLLSEIDQNIYKEVKSYAQIEFDKLHTAINNKSIQAVNYKITFPTGILYIDFFKPGRCFIATAAFRTEDAFPVFFLRYFRDHHLSRKILGRKFIDWYYLNGEKLASLVEKSDLLRLFVKTAITALVFIISKFYPYHPNHRG